MKKDYVASVAEQLIEQLEAGTAPWLKPWRPGTRFMPFNPITGKDYRGMNAVILLMTAESFGYGDARWMTYRQAASQDAQVRRGEKSTIIQYWKWREERPAIGPDGVPLRDADGKAVIEVVELVRPRVFAAAVFNAAQIDGLPEPEPRLALPEWQRHELAEASIHRAIGRAPLGEVHQLIRPFSRIDRVARTMNAAPEIGSCNPPPATQLLNRHRPLRHPAQSPAISCMGASRTPAGSAPRTRRHAGVRQTCTFSVARASSGSLVRLTVKSNTVPRRCTAASQAKQKSAPTTRMHSKHSPCGTRRPLKQRTAHAQSGHYAAQP